MRPDGAVVVVRQSLDASANGVELPPPRSLALMSQTCELTSAGGTVGDQSHTETARPSGCERDSLNARGGGS